MDGGLPTILRGIFSDFRLQFARIRSNNLSDPLAIDKDVESRHGTDLGRLGDFRHLIDIHLLYIERISVFSVKSLVTCFHLRVYFQEDGLGVLLRKLLILGCNHFAWTTLCVFDAFERSDQQHRPILNTQPGLTQVAK